MTPYNHDGYGSMDNAAAFPTAPQPDDGDTHVTHVSKKQILL